MDTLTPAGELLFGVVTTLAQFERSIIQNWVQVWVNAARKRGREGTLKVTGERKMGLIEVALAAGKSEVEVAHAFGVDRSTMHRHLKRSEAQTLAAQQSEEAAR